MRRGQRTGAAPHEEHALEWVRDVAAGKVDLGGTGSTSGTPMKPTPRTNGGSHPQTPNCHPTHSKPAAKIPEPRSPVMVMRPTLPASGMMKDRFAEIGYAELKSRRTLLLTYGVGYTGKEKVLAYDCDALIAWGGFPGLSSKAAIFRLRATMMWQLLFLSVVACVSMGLLKTAMSASDEPPEYWKEQVLPINTLALYTNTLVVFILGFFISLNVARWWQMVSVHLNRLLEASKDTIFSLLSVLGQPEFKEVRARVARYTLLSHKLVYLCARNNLTPAEFDKIVTEGLATHEELDALQDESRARHVIPQNGSVSFVLAEIPWLWINQMITKLFEQKLFPPPMFSLLHRTCLDARHGIDGIEMQLNSPLPFTYCHLVAFLVHGACGLIAVRCGMQIAISSTPLQATCEAMSSFVLSALYLGLLAIAAVMMDPFGDDVIDIPAGQLQQSLWSTLKAYEAFLQREDLFQPFLMQALAASNMDVIMTPAFGAKRVVTQPSIPGTGPTDEEEAEQDDDDDDDDDGD